MPLRVGCYEFDPAPFELFLYLELLQVAACQP